MLGQSHFLDKVKMKNFALLGDQFFQAMFLSFLNEKFVHLLNQLPKHKKLDSASIYPKMLGAKKNAYLFKRALVRSEMQSSLRVEHGSLSPFPTITLIPHTLLSFFLSVCVFVYK